MEEDFPALLRQRVEKITAQLAEASEGRYPAPKLIPVTKLHPVEMILPLKELGYTEIGENHVQEIREKLPALKENFQFHMIGRLQSNKVKYIIEDVCLIQSLDRMSLAEEINRQAIKHERVMPCLVQVSPAGEEQKGGIAPEELRPFLQELARMEGIQVRGLMAVMPNTPDQAYLSRLFGNMRSLFDQLRQDAPERIRMEELSMGMSGDYLLAARYGATMVRIGSGLFGPRDYGTH